LRVPTSPFGLEISKLAVTSGVRSRARWEFYWKNENENTFSLIWNNDSRFPSFRITPASVDTWGGMTGWTASVLLIAMGILCFWLKKITQTLFLPHKEIRLNLPSREWQTLDDVDRDYLVLSRAQAVEVPFVVRFRDSPDVTYCDLRFSSSNSEDQSRMISELESPTTGRTNKLWILDHFESGLVSPKVNAERLTILERLASKPSLKRLLVSSVDPLYYFTEECRSILVEASNSEDVDRYILDRWIRALSNFQRVTLKETDRSTFYRALRAFLKAHRSCGDEHETNESTLVHEGDLRPLLKVRPSCQQFALWIYLECRSTSKLRAEGMRLLQGYKHDVPMSRDSLVNYIGSIMDADYRVIWADLTRKERTVLYQLALDGWANPHPENERAIEELERKVLINKRVMFRVMNASFTRFIKSPEHLDEIQLLQTEASESTWQALKIVLVAAVVGFFIWMLWAEAELFRIGMAYVAALGAVISTAINFFAGKRPAVESVAPHT
jgi:hypothetical protein